MTNVAEYIAYNYENISNKAVEWMKEKYPFRTRAYEKCTRDISYILDAYYQDLTNNASSKTVYIANKFWKGNVRQIETYKVEIAVHNYIVDFIKSETTQDQHESLDNLKNIFVSILENGSTISQENMEYLDVIQSFQHCQRNWDHSKVVDDETIDFLLEAGYNVPTKQNLNSFKIVCIKDRDEILKWASVARNEDETISNVGVETIELMKQGKLQNPQTNANLLYLFFVNQQERTGERRQHRERGTSPTDKQWHKDKNFEMGLAASAIGIAANMKGMKSGFCGCIWHDAIPESWTEQWGVKPSDLTVMMGVGYPLYDDHTVFSEEGHRKESYVKAPYEKIIV